MPGLLDGLIDLGNPMAAHPLNRGVSWWLPLPGSEGGGRLRDLSGRFPGQVGGSVRHTTAGGPNGLPALLNTSSVATSVYYTVGGGVHSGTSFGVTASVYALGLTGYRSIFGDSSNAFTTQGGLLVWFSGANRSSGFTISANRWYRLGVTYDGSTFRFYVDGHANGTAAYGSATFPTNAFTSVASNQATNAWHGMTGDVRVYRHTPTAAEMWADYDQWGRGFPDLLRRWRRRSFAFAEGGGAFTLACDAGSYSLSGTAAALRVARRLTCDGGSYSLSGTAAAPEFGRRLAADSGSYSLSGQAASVEFGRRLAADAGSYSLSGQAAGVRAARELELAAGSYSLSGQDAALDYSGAGGFTLACESGSYSLSGQAVALRVVRRVALDVGVYTLAGQPATLPAARRLPAASGSYALAGTDAGLTYAPATADLLDGLGAYYRLDGNLDDSSGNSRHLSVVNATTYGAGKLNTALAAGSATRTGFGVTPGDAFSVAFWVRYGAGLEETAAAFAFNGFADQLTVGGYESGFYASAVFGNAEAAGAEVAAADGDWVHLALTWDGATARLYANGAAVDSGAAAAAGWFDGAGLLVATGAAGPVDEVAVYGRALSAAEVALLYDGGDGFDPTARGGGMAGSVSLSGGLAATITLSE